MSSNESQAIVIGGGIAGLSACWQLCEDGVDVTLLEASDRVGGKICSSRVGDRLVDEAADAFLARVPHGVDLARRLGLEHRLVAPAARSAQIWSTVKGDLSGREARLIDLPKPNVLGVPLDAGSVKPLFGNDASAAISDDLSRVALSPLHPRVAVRPDDTIGSLVRRRLGDLVHESLVDPLVGSINAGDTDELSLHACSPQLLKAAETSASLVAGLAAQARSRPGSAAVFYSFHGGVQVIVDALAERLDDRIRTGSEAASVDIETQGSAKQITVTTKGGKEFRAGAVVLACAANEAAKLVSDRSNVAGLLRQVPLVSVCLVTLVLPAGSIRASSEVSGFLVPRGDPEIDITACSYVTHKWPHLGEGVDIVRVSLGHARDQSTPNLGDLELIDRARADLLATAKISAEPLAARVSRWPRAFPQYLAGHLDRIAIVEDELKHDGVFLAGMSYRGIGIPSNIDQGRSAGRAALSHLLQAGTAWSS